ncbi:RsmD family RNA methyltransferase [Daejeonella sp.]|uniref:RsmD family RNA methyltransferase n=1 Tax=Daejeonella sp. TaxID=2805397 RepID=UPI00272765CA|nr:RsmD family RNA methyltransferase [Daejeonella sp.]MDO8993463.1 RsmD family RNA methyltransferase [Daejeonella sp.]MDP2413062.1 RsmD family RNA methyltransferase [Daejeonella sp.]
MRIIGGKLKGLRLNPPAKLPVRPTTDVAKEALFNILFNQFDFEKIRVLDLFSGTGNISMEFASRGVPNICSVDRDFGCYNYLKTLAKQYDLPAIKSFKADVFKFLESETEKYDLIFADPPYDLPQINIIAKTIFDRNLLKADGYLIIEHSSMKKLDNHQNYIEQRQYGSSSFSLFREKQGKNED